MLKIPLLIGGATTSRAHTAVKIAPNYEGPVVYVPDASRSVSVAQSLLTPRPRDAVHRGYRGRLRAHPRAARQQEALPMLSLAEARANKTKVDWAAYTPPAPKFIGRRVFKNVDLAEIAEVHRLGPVLPDLGPGRPVPGDPDRRVVGESAPKVFAEGQALLSKMIDGRWLTANGVIALLPAPTRQRRRHRDLYRRDRAPRCASPGTACASRASSRWSTACSGPNQCLADFIAPKASGVADYIGMFAVTAGLGIEKYGKAFRGRARRLLRRSC